MRTGQEATNLKTAPIAEVAGRTQGVGRNIRKPDDLAQRIRDGLPAASLTTLGQHLHLGSRALSQRLGIPQRTLTRRLGAGARLTAESDRTVRLARVYAHAVEMLGAGDYVVRMTRYAQSCVGR